MMQQKVDMTFDTTVMYKIHGFTSSKLVLGNYATETKQPEWENMPQSEATLFTYTTMKTPTC